jgi:hypothetical protein
MDGVAGDGVAAGARLALDVLAVVGQDVPAGGAVVGLVDQMVNVSRT